jgi:phosphoribosylformylglycinamidine cyclo-ligase
MEHEVKAARTKAAYALAGVDIDTKMAALRAVGPMIQETATRGVLGGIGHFGGMFASPGAGQVLVASTDGVGTKLKVAVMARRHDTVGQDLVNHCVNDILVLGARPLFFLDYLGASHLEPAVFTQVVSGLCKACRENGCALIGGETAEMPGLYPAGEYDLVGTIVGSVDRRRIVTGRGVRLGDVLIGLASGGLQTNGYSLARKVIFDQCGLTVNDSLPGTRYTVAEALLAVHRSFLRPVQAVTVPIQGMAHITGGGFVDNVPRVLPEKCVAVIDRNAWRPPTVFTFLEKEGRIDHDEMYRVFNMGIGFVLIVRAKDASRALQRLQAARAEPVVIGRVERGKRGVVYRDTPQT